MEKELGLESYAIYFKLLEILREQIDFKYPMDDMDLLADEIGSTEQKVRVVICNYQLFQVDSDNMFFSASFNHSMEPYLKSVNQRKLAGKASAVQRSFNGRSTVAEQSKVNESKVKESKVNEIKEEQIKLNETPNIKILGTDSDKYITIQPKTLGSIKYRINAEEGLKEYFQINMSHIPRPELTKKFLVDRNGKAYEDFQHLFNDFQKFVELSFKR